MRASSEALLFKRHSKELCREAVAFFRRDAVHYDFAHDKVPQGFALLGDMRICLTQINPRHSRNRRTSMTTDE